MIVFQQVDFEVNRVGNRGRDRKSWGECVKKDSVELGLHREWALDQVRRRVRWRGLVQPVQA